MAKFWEIFKKFEEAPATEQETIASVLVGESAMPEEAQAFLASKGLRRGMWVITPEGVGILTGVYNGFVEVMLTDDAGCNKRSQNFESGKVSQAKHGQIPKPRRPEPALASKLGY